MDLKSVPVFMRIGDGTEYEIGTFTPQMGLEGVDLRTPLAALLREAADETQRVTDGD
jgi:hypothetical protein